MEPGKIKEEERMEKQQDLPEGYYYRKVNNEEAKPKQQMKLVGTERADCKGHWEQTFNQKLSNGKEH